MSSILYLVRHAHIQAESIFVGQTDLPLSPLGCRQVLGLQNELSGLSFSVAWSSPLQRCRETAACILEKHPSCSLQVDDAFKEVCLGAWEGKEKAWVRANDPVWAQRGKDMYTCSPPQGESLGSLSRRVLPAFNRVCAEARQYPYSLLVAHRSVNQAILACYLALPQDIMPRLSQPYAAVSRLVLE